MYTLKRYIFRTDIIERYASEFNNYAIEKIYGSNILIGSEIEADYKNKSPEEGE